MLLLIVRLDQAERRQIAVVEPGALVLAVRGDELGVDLLRERVVGRQRIPILIESLGRIVPLPADDIAIVGIVVPLAWRDKRIVQRRTCPRVVNPELGKHDACVIGIVQRVGGGAVAVQQDLLRRVVRLLGVIASHIDSELVVHQPTQCRTRGLMAVSAESAQGAAVLLLGIDRGRQRSVGRRRLALQLHLAGEVVVVADAVHRPGDGADLEEHLAVDQREVRRGLSVQAMMRTVGDFHGARVVALRLGSDQADCATESVLAEQRALGPVQHFDALDVRKIK